MTENMVLLKQGATFACPPILNFSDEVA